MNRITSVEQVKRDTRFVSAKIEDRRIRTMIEEAEQIYIKPLLGESLYVDILQYINTKDTENITHYQLLLEGGIYEKDEESKYFEGLIKTLNYYVYAKLLRHLNYTLTRSGVVVKDTEYSSPITINERMILEKDTLMIADSYSKDCLNYLHDYKHLFPKYSKSKNKNRLNFKLIGGRQ